MQDTGEGRDVFELFGDSEAKEEPEAGTQAPHRARATAVKISEFEPEKQPIRKRTRNQTSKTSKARIASTASTVAAAPVVGRKKQTASSK